MQSPFMYEANFLTLREGRQAAFNYTGDPFFIKKARVIQKNINFCFIDYAKAFDCVGHNKLWKILKEMGIPDLTCLLRNLYAGQEATVRTGHEQWTDSKSGKEYVKAVYCYPAYLTSPESSLQTP